VAEKTGAALEKYNRASRLAAAAAEIWRRETGGDEAHLAAVVRSRADAADRLRAILAGGSQNEFSPSDLLPRFAHFLTENEQVIPAAGAALDRGDMESFGRWVDRSQQAAETLLRNQVPETVWLSASAREFGAVAASAFGAGFGGSVWALVAADRADDLLTAWQQAYSERFPEHRHQATFFTTAAGPALCRLV